MTHLTLLRHVILGMALVADFTYAATHTVKIENFKFQPSELVVSVGDTVTWVNLDSTEHTTSSTNYQDADRKWDSDLLAKNATFSFTFNTPGNIRYHCNPHPVMQGRIIVQTQDQVRAEIGKKIVANTPPILPIELKLGTQSPDQVYLGSYLTNVAGVCADCHSCPTYAPGRNPFMGQRRQLNGKTYLAGGVTFGPFVSRNLTPNSNGKPAGMTLRQFKRALRTGHSPNSPSGQLLQVMPWPLQGLMTDNDLEAIYAYLKTIPSVKTPLDFCSTAGQ